MDAGTTMKYSIPTTAIQIGSAIYDRDSKFNLVGILLPSSEKSSNVFLKLRAEIICDIS